MTQRVVPPRSLPTCAGWGGGITAAVVGVIANLAVVFGEAVLLPRGASGGLDLFSLFVGAAALTALAWRRLDLLWVVGAGAAAGLLRVLLR